MEKHLIWAVCVFFTVFIVLLVFNNNVKNNGNLEMAKTGLQQCMVNGHILWQKECR